MGNWCKTLNPLAPVFAFLWHRHEWSIPLVKQDSRREALDSCSDPYLLKQPVNRCFACVRFSELRVLDYYIFRYQPSDFWKAQLLLMRDIDFMLWCIRTYHRVRICARRKKAAHFGSLTWILCEPDITSSTKRQRSSTKTKSNTRSWCITIGSFCLVRCSALEMNLRGSSWGPKQPNTLKLKALGSDRRTLSIICFEKPYGVSCVYRENMISQEVGRTHIWCARTLASVPTFAYIAAPLEK